MRPSQPLQQYRYFLKDCIRQQIDFSQTAQSTGVPPPPMQKVAPEGASRIDLPEADEIRSLGDLPLSEAIASRRSRRRYSQESLALPELAFLLWVTQGVREVLRDTVSLRTVPSAGARHAFETYVCALRVDGLDVGIYRYLPLCHQLVGEGAVPGFADRIVEACLGQEFAGSAAAVFVWTTIPYRMEWRYGLAAHKVIALDAGHVCQNLYLACGALGAGTCAIGAYDQEKMDALIGVDGEEEFTIYIAPVGKVDEP
jgi:SagB-type dehydrogenase family enzyme